MWTKIKQHLTMFMQLDHNSSDSDGPKSPGEGDQVDGNETKSASMPPHTGHMAGEHVLTPREATAQKKFQEEMQDVSKTPLSKGAGHTGDTTERKTGKKQRKRGCRMQSWECGDCRLEIRLSSIA